MFNILLISFALAMDSFSVAICAGTTLNKPGLKKPLLVGFYFGFFQALMAFLGWLGGEWVADKIGEIDHWFAFLLLLIIGGKMIYEFFHNHQTCSFSFGHRNLFILAIATSIDAIGAGASIAIINEKLLIAFLAIGIISFILSFLGVRAGRFLSKYVKNYAELLGGVLLILIGLRILIEHGAINI